MTTESEAPGSLSDGGDGSFADLRPTVHFCPVCGSRFSDDASFCPFDGERLEERATGVPEDDPLIGSVVDGRYEIDGVLGEGGMGTVYAVRHTALGRRFALKALRAELANEYELSVRFLREARAAAAVSHPNVVQINDFGTLPTGQPYFVMELLEGTSLTRVSQPGRLPLARVVGLAKQIARALEAAHDAGVVHRDLKPDNIIVCSTEGGDLVKVVDFGLAKVAGQSRLTKAGMVFGTPHYVSPEQASGDPVDHRSDTYSLGVVLYELLTGKVPFEADTFMGVMTKHMYVAPTPPHELLPGEELGALEDVTLKCLEKRPERRFQSMGELVTALESAGRFCEEGFVPQPATTRHSRRPSLLDDILTLQSSPPPPELPVRSWAPLLIVGAVGAIVAGVLLAVWWNRTSLSAANTSSPLDTAAGPAVPHASTLVHAVRQGSVAAAETDKPSGSATLAPGGPTNFVEQKGARTSRPTYGRILQSKPASSTVPPAGERARKIRRHLRSGEIIDPWSQ